jgi:hypothetical protein
MIQWRKAEVAPSGAIFIVAKQRAANEIGLQPAGGNRSRRRDANDFVLGL